MLQGKTIDVQPCVVAPGGYPGPAHAAAQKSPDRDTHPSPGRAITGWPQTRAVPPTAGWVFPLADFCVSQRHEAKGNTRLAAAPPAAIHGRRFSAAEQHAAIQA
jgi:hypothetical protein